MSKLIRLRVTNKFFAFTWFPFASWHEPPMPHPWSYLRFDLDEKSFLLISILSTQFNFGGDHFSYLWFVHLAPAPSWASVLEVEGGTAAALAWFTSLDWRRKNWREGRCWHILTISHLTPVFSPWDTYTVHSVDCLMNVRVDIAV